MRLTRELESKVQFAADRHNAKVLLCSCAYIVILWKHDWFGLWQICSCRRPSSYSPIRNAKLRGCVGIAAEASNTTLTARVRGAGIKQLDHQQHLRSVS